MLPQRTPEHFSACSEMAQMSWYEPPLVLSRNYCEPRNFFNKCAERSTRSVVNPAVPVVPWKVHGRSPLAPHLTQSGERDAASPGLLMNVVFAHNGMSRACGCAQAKFT
jgi:hypothetical protein